MFLLRRKRADSCNGRGKNGDPSKEKEGCWRSTVQGNWLQDQEAKKALDQAAQCIKEGKYEKALLLLKKTEQLLPTMKGLPELSAVAEVWHAATQNSCRCQLMKQRRPDWYSILKVEEHSDIEDIKRQYRHLALLLHPDKNKYVKAEGAFKLVSEAYSCLSDRRKRAAFDMERPKLQCKQCSAGQIANKVQLRESELKLGDHKFKHFKWNRVPEKETLKHGQESARARICALVRAWTDRRCKWMEELDHRRERSQMKVTPCLYRDEAKDYSPPNQYQKVRMYQERQKEKVESSCSFLLRGSSNSYRPVKKKESAKSNLAEHLKEKREKLLPQERSRTFESLADSMEKLRQHNSVCNKDLLIHRKKAVNGDGRSSYTSGRMLDCNKECFTGRFDSSVAAGLTNSKGSTDFSSKHTNSGCDEFAIKQSLDVNNSISCKTENLEGRTLKSSVEHYVLEHGVSLQTTEPKSSDISFTSGSDAVSCPLNSSIEFQNVQHKNGIWNRQERCPTMGIHCNHTSQESERMKDVMISRRSVHSRKQFSQSSVTQNAIAVANCCRDKREVDEGMKCRTTCEKAERYVLSGNHLDMEETIVQSQKQKSEELLKTLEQLREDAKSVATTLNRLRELVGSESGYTKNSFIFHKYQMAGAWWNI